jgi:hypothetical protein
MARPKQRLRARIDVWNGVTDDLDAKVRVCPSPEQVARLWDSHHGWEAVLERWGWLGKWALEKLAADGRRLIRAKAGAPLTGPRRSTTPEQDQAAFEVVMRLGVHRAMRETGLGQTVLYRLLRERGVTEAPRLSQEERNRASREGLARAKAARAAA